MGEPKIDTEYSDMPADVNREEWKAEKHAKKLRKQRKEKAEEARKIMREALA